MRPTFLVRLAHPFSAICSSLGMGLAPFRPTAAALALAREEHCCGTDLGADVCAARETVQELLVPLTLTGHDARLFSLGNISHQPAGDTGAAQNATLPANGLVAIVETNKWLRDSGFTSSGKHCQTWEKMRAGMTGDINSERCSYSYDKAAEALHRFQEEFRELLRVAFNVSVCLLQKGPRAYITRLSRAFASDDLHSDVDCEWGKKTNRRYLTVLSYPHEAWESSWEGHSEWVARACEDEAAFHPESGRQLPAALRVAPRPGRTVIFDSKQPHRATWPSDTASSMEHGESLRMRYSVVLQLGCSLATSDAEVAMSLSPGPHPYELDRTDEPTRFGFGAPRPVFGFGTWRELFVVTRRYPMVITNAFLASIPRLGGYRTWAALLWAALPRIGATTASVLVAWTILAWSRARNG
eukprot:TRINITY_DN49792_c0_g1_i1.p1 TRINITY_DN49792_c0_g1~~TRINITY_DN49792_c0_g1_i1.p1  ORF type:complete len:413 (+),score=40.77 TRINITY_DN49792_c0_g1_i1:30-1268(+)